MKFLSYFKGHRTQVLARIMMLIAIVQQYAVAVFPADKSGYVLFGAALLMEIMRWFTSTPVMKNK